MDLNSSVKENIENVKENIEYEMKMQKLKEDLVKSFESYNSTLKYLAADAPIETLCLPASLVDILIGNGILRIYDVFNMDLAKIKGIGPIRLRQLTTSVNQFLSMI